MSKTPDFTVIDAPAQVFHFKISGSDKLWSLPTVKSLPMRLYLGLVGTDKLSVAEQTAKASELVEALCPGLIENLTVEAFNDVLSAWYEASGISLGESSSSAD